MISYGDIKSGEAALPVAKADANSIPSLIERASKRLSEAKTSAEVLEAKAASELALHYAKVTKAANESHADCLRIITRAEIRMAGEIDRGQKAGEVAKREANLKQNASEVPASDLGAATLKDLGVTKQRVSEWRKVAEAGEEKVEQAISEALADGRAPTKADVHRAAGIVKDKPKSDEDHQFEELQRAWNTAGEGTRARFLTANNLRQGSNQAETGGGDVDRSAMRASSAVGLGATNSPEGAAVSASSGRPEGSKRLQVLREPTNAGEPDENAYESGATSGERAADDRRDVEASGGAASVITNSPSATPAEAAPASPKPPAHAGAANNSHRWSKLRPHCLTPECCAGVGREHCHACKKAMADREAA